MTTMAAEIRAEAARRKQSTCAFGTFTSTLTPEARVDFLSVLFDTTISINAIHTVLVKRGVTIGETLLKRHRKRDCRVCIEGTKETHGKARK